MKQKEALLFIIIALIMYYLWWKYAPPKGVIPTGPQQPPGPVSPITPDVQENLQSITLATMIGWDFDVNEPPPAVIQRPPTGQNPNYFTM